MIFPLLMIILTPLNFVGRTRNNDGYKNAKKQNRNHQ